MFAAMLFAFSIIALSQFALYYWRSVLAGVALRPISDQVLAAARVENGQLSAGDFSVLAQLHELTPQLDRNRNSLGTIRLYYRMIQAVDLLLGSRVQAVAVWSEKERTICARYVAVQIDHVLQANMALAASIHSC